MKKFIVLLFVVFVAAGCSQEYESNLKSMRNAFSRYITTKDIDNKTQTKVDYVEAISYTEIPPQERLDSADYYLCKIHLKSTWSYIDGSTRIFNVDDTLDCYFDKNINVIRVKDLNK